MQLSNHSQGLQNKGFPWPECWNNKKKNICIPLHLSLWTQLNVYCVWQHSMERALHVRLWISGWRCYFSGLRRLPIWYGVLQSSVSVSGSHQWLLWSRESEMCCQNKVYMLVGRKDENTCVLEDVVHDWKLSHLLCMIMLWYLVSYLAKFSPLTVHDKVQNN